MEELKVGQSVETYSFIIHGYARIKKFQESRALLTKMVEDGLLPVPETYNGLILAYGNYGLYDDMSKCVKMMESAGCYPNEITYNILIGEFARGGLVERMEKFYRAMLSKRMILQSHTLMAMVEAYADLGISEKMEKMYFKVLNSRTYMKDALIRKIANVYVENGRFARLGEFGNEIDRRTGRSELLWCILLLSSAGLLSKKGINSISQEMDIAKVRWSTTITNIFALFYLKMKDFKALNFVFSNAIKHRADPDMLTVSILFDAYSIGFSCTHLLEKWKGNAYLEAAVEMRTDPLVMSTFGKGPFLLKCEKLYTALDSKAREKKLWKYIDLIRLVLYGQFSECQ
ncbi:hypothetical protein KSP40_PGU010365 [Platanthera guangdongensis]|uniref:Pentatricopeptide repeat-containing protein n=1 Tax=Platanthera guangdongensis TaxID=2320717 RepID=A0ABR2LRE3_9ASPA